METHEPSTLIDGQRGTSTRSVLWVSREDVWAVGKRSKADHRVMCLLTTLVLAASQFTILTTRSGEAIRRLPWRTMLLRSIARQSSSLMNSECYRDHNAVSSAYAAAYKFGPEVSAPTRRFLPERAKPAEKRKRSATQKTVRCQTCSLPCMHLKLPCSIWQSFPLWM